MENIYLKSKGFIDKDTTNYNEISVLFEQICESILEKYNIKKKIKILFEDNKAFGNCATEYPDKISFNKLRYDVIKSLKIDCTKNGHLEKLYDFYNHYNENCKNSKYKVCLYNFMKKYIGFGLQDYFLQMGSYKTIKYELLETLFHESQHIVQEKYKTYIYENNMKFADEEVLLVFTMLFNEIYNRLIENNIQFNYVRQNYSFPIEFDARYVALVMSNTLRQKYFIEDILFSQSILNNDILPKDVSGEKLAESIFIDFENLYRLYKSKLGLDLESVFFTIGNYKKKIVSQLTNRYVEMKRIYLNLKNKLEQTT
ncbi:MAG: hypothetical protein E7356_01755 [Clostridiales bacterium]|nr:hypothetical protein [Clostridiales bacterium]